MALPYEPIADWSKSKLLQFIQDNLEFPRTKIPMKALAIQWDEIGTAGFTAWDQLTIREVICTDEDGAACSPTLTWEVNNVAATAPTPDTRLDLKYGDGVSIDLAAFPVGVTSVRATIIFV